MSKPKKYTINVPEELLKQACVITKLGRTETLLAGLKELLAQQEREAVEELKGKVKSDLESDKS